MRSLINTISVTTAWTEIDPDFDIGRIGIYPEDGDIEFQLFDETQSWVMLTEVLSGEHGIEDYDCIKIRIRSKAGTVSLNYSLLGLIDFGAAQDFENLSTTSITTSQAIDTEGVVFFISASADLTVTLPTPVDGRHYFLKRTDSNDSVTVTIDGNGSDTIDGELTQELDPYDCMEIVSDGTNWSII